jgi:hypothetical protein
MFNDMDQTSIRYLPLEWRSDVVRLKRYYNFIADDILGPRSLASANHDANVVLQFLKVLQLIDILDMKSGYINT